METRDWFVIVLFAAIWVAGTVYLFMHHSESVFAIWAGLFATMGSIYHWLVYADSKRPDA